MNESISLRVSVIDRCQLRCRYCRPEEGVELVDHAQIISYEEIVRFVEFLQQNHDLQKVRITGGDPLVRRGIEDLVKMLSDLSIPDIALTTNAQLLKGKAQLLREAGLNRINISFDSLNPDTFHHLTRGGSLDDTLAGIDAAVNEGLNPVKLNMVVIRGVNDSEIVEMLDYALTKGVHLRYLELMPVGTAVEGFEGGYMSSEETRAVLSERYELEAMDYEEGSTSRLYRIAGGDQAVGFISPYSESFCGGCRRLRLTSDGHLLGCLSRGQTIPVRGMLGDSARDGELADVVKTALNMKGPKPGFPEEREMSAIGG